MDPEKPNTRYSFTYGPS